MASLSYGPLPAPPDHDPGAARARAIGSGALTMVGLGAVLLAGRAVSIHAPACPFRTVTGVPCPGCGMTRLADAVAHGRLATATGADGAGVAILAVLVVLAVTFLVQVVIRKHAPPGWMRRPILAVGLVALVAVHWATTIISGGLPPS